MENRQIDVAIIGGGMAGLTAGIYLRRSSLTSVVIEKGAPGGKLNNIHRIDNYPAMPKVSGPDLAMSLFNQTMELGVEFAYGSVESVSKEGNLFIVKTDAGDYAAKTVIIATGVETKKLGVPGEKEHDGKGVSYCATCDGNFFKGKDVAVVGNKDHAVEDVLYLSGLVNHLYFLMPEPLETTEAHLEELKQCQNVTLIEGGKPVRIEGEVTVEKVVYQVGENEKELQIQGIFPLYGERSSSQFLSALKPNSNKGFLVCDENMMTSVPGLYACGDIVDKKLRQLVNAAGEAAVAATNAIVYCRSVH